MFDDRSTLGSSVCCFCRDLHRQGDPIAFERDSFVNKLCRESEHFATFPSLSPLSEGHSLIVPKYHVTSMGQVPKEHHSELLAFLKSVLDVLEAALGSVVLFEHGVAAGEPGGCGVQHAHLHLLPLAADVIARVERRLHDEWNLIVARDLESFLSTRRSDASYMLFGTMSDSLSVVSSSRIPSQYMRRLVAEEAGYEHWDWREYFGWRAFRSTRMILLQDTAGSS